MNEASLPNHLLLNLLIVSGLNGYCHTFRTISKQKKPCQINDRAWL